MRNVVFDVLVVYSGAIASSASNCSDGCNQPFSSSREMYNQVYGYFLNFCKRSKLKAAFTTSDDITGAGTCRSYWEYKENRWLKRNSPCYSDLIFDKFSPISREIKAQRKLLFSSYNVTPFNDPHLFSLFFDKQKTFNTLKDLSIPTVTVSNGTKTSLLSACKKLKHLMNEHANASDFGSELIMKDRFGAGGLAVFKFDADETDKMYSVVQEYPHISFILQPFAKFDKGFTYKNNAESTDIRLIYFEKTIVQAYIRVAKPGDFRCNEHQGGQLTYLNLEEIPEEVLKHSSKISKFLKNTNSLYALDFIITNSGNTYLLEGNTGPGLDWNTSLIENEIKSKELIQNIVEELALRVSESKLAVTDSVAGELITVPENTDYLPITSFN